MIANEEQMLALGSKLARALHVLEKKNKNKNNAVTLIFLHGLLGAGKTTLVRGFLRALGVTGRVKSPTYTLVESYKIAEQPIFHFDFYRINDPEELNYLGLQDYFAHNHICFIEWAEQGGKYLPHPDLNLHIDFVGDDKREVRIDAESGWGKEIIRNLD